MQERHRTITNIIKIEEFIKEDNIEGALELFKITKKEIEKTKDNSPRKKYLNYLQSTYFKNIYNETT